MDKQETHCTQVRHLPLSNLPPQVIEDLVAQLRNNHHLDGAYTESGLPVLGFRLPPKDVKETRTRDFADIRIFPALFAGELGAFLAMRARFVRTGEASHVAIPASSAIASRVLPGKFYSVFFHGHHPLFALEWESFVHSDISASWLSLGASEPASGRRFKTSQLGSCLVM
jgi:hypothetical protein